jgi:hypothetical protein
MRKFGIKAWLACFAALVLLFLLPFALAAWLWGWTLASSAWRAL